MLQATEFHCAHLLSDNDLEIRLSQLLQDDPPNSIRNIPLGVSWSSSMHSRLRRATELGILHLTDES